MAAMFKRKPKHAPFAFDPKPLRITVTLTDGQTHTWAMGEGDSLGYGCTHVAVTAPNEVVFTVSPPRA